MYIKNKYKQLFRDLDNELKLPAKFYTYLSSIYDEQKLIIKSKDICKCPKCNALFNSKVKIGNVAKCPKCKHSYIVKSSKIKSFQFKDQFAVLDRYKDYYIIRAFEATTWNT
jgi:acetyl-CoA carboxylase beta subunit